MARNNFSVNAVQIVITASDQASATLTNITTALNSISGTIGGSVLGSLRSFAAVSVESFKVSRRALLDFLELIEQTDTLLRRFAGIGLGDVFGQAIDAAVQDLSDASKRSLTQVLGAVRSVGAEVSGLNFQAATEPLQKNIKVFVSTADGLFETLERAAIARFEAVGRSVGDLRKPAELLVNSFDAAFTKISAGYNNFTSQFKGIGDTISGAAISVSGAEEAIGLFQSLQSRLSPFVEGLAQVGFQIAQIQGLLGTLQPLVASGPYQLLIQQQITLREQLIATQSLLAGTNKLFQNGIEITSPLEGIKALEGPIRQAIADIRKESVELVGVTSSQLVEVFQIVAGQLGNIGGSLTDAKDLTLDFSASLGTLGIPLFQARQEIGSILVANIDQNSVLAKSLNISNEQVKNWQQQGVLVQRLRERLDAFRQGNALAARSFSGITSNIQEVIENIGLKAGEQLLDPILDVIDRIYQSLLENQDGITQFVQQISEGLLDSVLNLVDGLGELLGASQTTVVAAVRAVFEALTVAINGLGDALKTAAEVGRPFFNILGSLGQFVNILNPLFQVAVQVKVLTSLTGFLTDTFERFGRGIPFVGEVLFLLEQRSSGLIGLLTGLNQSVAPAATAFLTLGANLGKIPALQGLVAKQFPILGEQIAALIPQASAAGIALVGLTQRFPILGKALEAIKGSLPQVTQGLVSFAKSNPALAQFAPQIEQIAEKIGVFSDKADIAATINEKLSNRIADLRKQVLLTGLRIAAIAGIVFLAVNAFDQLVLKNEALLETLSQIGQGLVSFARDIGSFLISPLGLATTAFGLATAAAITFGTTLKGQIVSNAIAGILGNLVASLGSLAGGLLAASKAATVLGGAQLGLIFSSAAASVSGLSVAVASGTGVLAAFKAAVVGVGAALGVLAATIGIVVGGIALIGIARYTKDLEESTKATEIYNEQTQRVGDRALESAQKLKNLSDQQKRNAQEGKALTEQEIRDINRLRQEGQGQIESVNDQIKRLQQAQNEAVGEENKRAIATQIASLEAVRGSLEKYVADLELAGNAVVRLQNRVRSLGEEFKRSQGVIDTTQKEAIANATEALQAGLASQSELEDQKVAITRDGLQRQLAETEKGLRELTTRFAQLSPEERDQAKDVQDEITRLRGQAADLRTKIVESELEQQNKLIERQAKRATEAAIAAEQDRTNALLRLRNANLISEEELNRARLQSTETRIQEEIRAEQGRLQLLLANERANSSAIRESRARLGQLTQQFLENEARLYDAYIALIKDKLERQAKAYENNLEAQNAKLRDQEKLYEALGNALENQLRIVQAQQGLLDATGGFLQNQLQALQDIQVSERRRQDLAQATALLQLQSLAQRQTAEQAIFEIQQRQNQLALERQQIENQIAQAQAEVQTLRGQANLTRAQEELRLGRITQEEFQAAVLEQQANLRQLGALQQQGRIIQQQRDLQPQLQAAERQQLQLRQAGERTSATVDVFRSLRPAQQAQVRDRITQSILDGLTGGGVGINDFVGRGQAAIGRFLQGDRNNELFRQLTPGLQQRLSDLSGASKPGVADLRPRQSEQLTNAIDGLNTTVRALQGPRSPLQLPAANGNLQPEIRSAIELLRQPAAGRPQQPNPQPQQEQPRGAVTVQVSAPITVNAKENQSPRAIAQSVNQQLINVTRRAIELNGGSRNIQGLSQ